MAQLIHLKEQSFYFSPCLYVSLEKILEHFLRFVDPYSIDKQGEDSGHQYRSGIYYVDNNDKDIIKNYFDNAGFSSYTKTSYLNDEAKAFIEGGKFYGVHKIDGTDWYIVAEGPASDFSSQYRNLVLMVFGILFVIILI